MEQSSSLPITGLTYTGVGIIGLWMVNRAAGKLFDSVAEPVLTPLAAHVRSFLFERSATAISKRLLTLYSVILWFMFATVFFAVGEINRWQMKDWNGAVLTLMFVPFMMPVVFKAGTFIRQPPRGFPVSHGSWLDRTRVINDVSDNQSQGRSVLCCWSAGSCAVSAFHLVWLDFA